MACRANKNCNIKFQLLAKSVVHTSCNNTEQSYQNHVNAKTTVRPTGQTQYCHAKMRLKRSECLVYTQKLRRLQQRVFFWRFFSSSRFFSGGFSVKMLKIFSLAPKFGGLGVYVYANISISSRKPAAVDFISRKPT